MTRAKNIGSPTSHVEEERRRWVERYAFNNNFTLNDLREIVKQAAGLPGDSKVTALEVINGATSMSFRGLKIQHVEKL